MLASRQTIRDLIDKGVIQDADEGSLGPVSYDLRTGRYFTDADSYEQGLTTAVLMPGDSTFVSSVETICLPSDLACRVLLKNSRIRQGLRLDAPLYFPGHRTRVFFRVTNVSSCEVTLGTDDGLAQIAFERVDRPVDTPYDGAFSDEFSFKGMGEYGSRYGREVRKLEEKAAELEGLERRIYGNVMVITAIIAAAYALVNVNGAAHQGADVRGTLCVNLATVGSFSLLAGLMGLSLRPSGRLARWLPWAVAALAFGADIALVALA